MLRRTMDWEVSVNKVWKIITNSSDFSEKIFLENALKKIMCLIVFLDYGYRLMLSFAFLAERRYHAVIVKKLHISQFHAQKSKTLTHFMVHILGLRTL